MKHLITMSACLLILMVILLQLVQNQKLLMQLEAGSYVVQLFCDNKDEDSLISSLSDIMDCEEREITVKKEGDTFLISAPVKAVLATPSFWGIEIEENHGIYCWKREVRDGKFHHNSGYDSSDDETAGFSDAFDCVTMRQTGGAP
ncbi:MAG: hypothetical protein IKK48_03780 [Firmicutes bacterium]|nr:hypothetical protein [Bacillota bacterium]